MTASGRSIPASHSLRLVHPQDERGQETDLSLYQKVARANREAAEATLNPNDARWVLAVRAAQALNGAQIRPEKRDRLLKLAHHLGMRPFDANLIIAIVQDRARRGELEMSHGAGISQNMVRDLAFVGKPDPAARRSWWAKSFGRVTLIIAMSLLWAIFILRWLLGAS